jgi:hypothetical protein
VTAALTPARAVHRARAWFAVHMWRVVRRRDDASEGAESGGRAAAGFSDAVSGPAALGGLYCCFTRVRVHARSRQLSKSEDLGDGNDGCTDAAVWRRQRPAAGGTKAGACTLSESGHRGEPFSAKAQGTLQRAQRLRPDTREPWRPALVARRAATAAPAANAPWRRTFGGAAWPHGRLHRRGWTASRRPGQLRAASTRHGAV